MLLVGCVSYGLALLVFMPASFALGIVKTWAAKEDVPLQITAEQGTLWKGSAQLSHPFFAGTIDWQLQPLKIPFGGQALDLVLQSAESRLTGYAGYTDGAVRITSDLTMNLQVLEPLLSRHRIDIGGKLSVSNLQVLLNLQTLWPDNASGSAIWSGGPVQYPVGRELNSVVLPPFNGIIVQQEQDIGLRVRDGEQQWEVMNMVLTPEGVVEIHVRKHLLDLAEAPWSSGGNPDDVVFKLQQKLWNI